jgi:hypothetical protein
VFAPIAGCGLPCVAAKDCDDKNPCTTDTCAGGKCAIAWISGGPCSDNDPCTTGELCSSGTCGGGKAAVCDDKNPCTTDSCDKSSGCVATPSSDGTSCSDGNGCTQNDTCTAGQCGGKPTQCQDGDDCTSDVCLASTGKCAFLAIPKCQAACKSHLDCLSKDVCFSGQCVDGACQNAALTATPCNDGNLCTASDACLQGACIGKPVVCNDGNPCTTEACSATSGKCVSGLAASGGGCDDGNPCTSGDICKSGVCKGSQNPCDDGDACTLDQCAVASGQCNHVAIAGCSATCKTAATCSDGNKCTLDTCTAGKCAHAPAAGAPSCDDGNPCTLADTCKGGVCTAGNPLACDDKNPCTTDACDVKSGKCASVALADGAACQDGSLCSQNDACKGGKCVAGPTLFCSDNNACTADSCVASTGKCQFITIVGCGKACKADADCKAAVTGCTEPACVSGVCGAKPASGKGCDDGNACTSADACQDGACAGAVVSCDDGKACTLDSCNVATGCSHQPIPGCKP